MLLVGAQTAAAGFTGFSGVAVRAEDPGARALMAEWAVDDIVLRSLRQHGVLR